MSAGREGGWERWAAVASHVLPLPWFPLLCAAIFYFQILSSLPPPPLPLFPPPPAGPAACQILAPGRAGEVNGAHRLWFIMARPALGSHGAPKTGSVWENCCCLLTPPPDRHGERVRRCRRHNQLIRILSAEKIICFQSWGRGEVKGRK